MSIAIATIIAIVGLGLVIFVHELGHFVMAKFLGISVAEFTLGFGPKIFSFKRGGTTYGMAIIPLGGYVRFIGSDLEPRSRQEPGSFSLAPSWKQTLVIMAGPLMNWLLALVLIIGLILVLGYFTTTTTVDKVLPHTAAQQAGFKAGDKLVTIDGQSVESGEEMISLLRTRPNQKTIVEIIRDGKKITLTPTVGQKDKMGFLGIQTRVIKKRDNFLSASWHGTVLTATGTVRISKVLVMIISKGTFFKEVSSPIGAVIKTAKIAKVNLAAYISILATLSITIAILNLFPMPPLDGGRLAILGLEVVRRKPLSPKKMMLIQSIGIALLLALMTYVVIADIQRLPILLREGPMIR